MMSMETPRQAQSLTIVPVFCGMSGWNRARRIIGEMCVWEGRRQVALMGIRTCFPGVAGHALVAKHQSVIGFSLGPASVPG